MRIIMLLVGALLSFNLYANPWTEEFPDPCQGSFISSPYCSLDPDPLHCEWYYVGATNHSLCEGRPPFPRVCEIRGSCINPGEPIPPNPCDTEPAWCQGPTYRPAVAYNPAPVVYELPPADLLVVEYIKATGPVGHYFLTANPDEMVALDSGSTWRRTGQTFKAWSEWNYHAAPVWRYFGLNHFYTLDHQQISNLRFEHVFKEEGVAFYALPVGPFGCVAGTRSVDLIYNAVTMRFVADAALAEQLLRTPGWYYSSERFCVQ